MAKKYDVFLSYRNSDAKDLAGRVFDHLTRFNLHVFFDKICLGPGSWPRSLENAIINSRVFLPILSGDYFEGERFGLAGDVCSWEFSLAMQLNKPFVPIVPDGHHPALLKCFDVKEQTERLADALHKIKYTQYIVLSDAFFVPSMKKLFRYICEQAPELLLPLCSPTVAPPAKRRRPTTRHLPQSDSLSNYIFEMEQTPALLLARSPLSSPALAPPTKRHRSKKRHLPPPDDQSKSTVMLGLFLHFLSGLLPPPKPTRVGGPTEAGTSPRGQPRPPKRRHSKTEIELDPARASGTTLRRLRLGQLAPQWVGSPGGTANLVEWPQLGPDAFSVSAASSLLGVARIAGDRHRAKVPRRGSAVHSSLQCHSA